MPKRLQSLADILNKWILLVGEFFSSLSFDYIKIISGCPESRAKGLDLRHSYRKSFSPKLFTHANSLNALRHYPQR